MRAGRFVAVGTDADVMVDRGDTTRMIDVGGRTVIPVLNNSHMHPIRGGLHYNLELRWDGVPSLDEINEGLFFAGVSRPNSERSYGQKQAVGPSA